MNKQDKGKGGRGIEWTDWTFNPIGGCFHACAWTMPDGTIANCYAEDVANRVAQAAYPQGFEHHYWKPNLLKEPLRVKTPSKIFVGSMADVFGHWVPDEQIQQVLDICEQAHWHQFQFLTKNPVRLKQFHFPANCWVGVSAPPTHMWGKELTYIKQTRLLQASLWNLAQCDAKVKWMSIEPLSFDIADDLYWEEDSGTIFPPSDFLKWAVIGAASNGKTIYQPKAEWVENVIDYLDNIGAAVFFKGNLKGNPAAETWREEFPATVKHLVKTAL